MHIARQNRKGNAAFTALSIIALLSFATLTVDIGHARMTRAQIQNAVDAAAHGAVAYLDRTDAGVADAEATAIYLGALNTADGSALTLTASDVTFGIYDWDDGTFTVTADATLINAVQVSHQKLDIGAIFALVSFGQETLGAGASSMAVVPQGSPATAVSCYLPIAVPSCAVDGKGTFEFKTSSNGSDSAGWAALPSDDVPKPDGNFLKQQLSGSDCQPGAVGDSVNVLNGEVAKASSVAAERINHGNDGEGPWSSGSLSLTAPDAWPTDQWDKPDASEQMASSSVNTDVFANYGIAGPVMLVSRDDNANGINDFCEDIDGDGVVDPPDWTKPMDLDGFAYGMIYDVKATGNPKSASVKINTDFNIDDYATEGGGTIENGLLYHEPPRIIPL